MSSCARFRTLKCGFPSDKLTMPDLGIDVVEGGDTEDGEAAVVGPRKPLSPSPLRSGAEAPLDGSEGRYSDATGRAR